MSGGTNYGQQDPFTQGAAAPTAIDGTVITLPGGGSVTTSLTFAERVVLGLPGWRKLSQRTFGTVPTNYASVSSLAELYQTWFNNRIWTLAGSALGSITTVNPADAAAGANIQSVFVSGIDVNGLLVQETVVLPGVPGSVPTVNSYNFINNFRAFTNGGNVTAAGNITIDIGGVNQARIIAGSSEAWTGAFRVPGDCSGFYVPFEWTSPTASGFLRSTFTPFSPTPQPIIFDLNVAGGTPKDIPLEGPLPPLTTLALFASSNTGGSIPAKGSIDMLLAPV